MQNHDSRVDCFFVSDLSGHRRATKKLKCFDEKKKKPFRLVFRREFDAQL